MVKFYTPVEVCRGVMLCTPRNILLLKFYTAAEECCGAMFPSP